MSPLPPPVNNPIPGLANSGLDFVKIALRMSRVIAAGEEPNAADAKDGLASLNRMIDSWAAQQLMIPGNSILDFPFVPNQAVYTLGKGGNFDTTRPARIDRASVVLTNQPTSPNEQPIEILNEAQWQDFILKTTPGTFPLAVYPDNGFPFNNLSFWPVPIVANSFRMYAWAAIAAFPDLATIFTFPPAYADAIQTNLAVRLADEFAGTISQTTITLALSSLAVIRNYNTPVALLECDEMFLGSGSMSASKLRSSLFGIP